MRLFRPFPFLRLVYPDAVFRITTTAKELCLTFDDGPHPDTTPVILGILESHNLKAAFFCNGREAEKYPGLVGLIVSKGHVIGNHGYDHLNGWKTNDPDYIENARRADEYTSSALFRPPYGRIRLSQYNRLKKKYKIVLWDLMPYDFDKETGGKRAFQILKEKIRPGSIIVLHDKATSTCLSFLDGFIKYTVKNGYKFVITPLSGKEQGSPGNQPFKASVNFSA
jgi:peptidoglycan/xylan/chitin deacetylase (PgdA/CDA1 family)